MLWLVGRLPSPCCDWLSRGGPAQNGPMAALHTPAFVYILVEEPWSSAPRSSLCLIRHLRLFPWAFQSPKSGGEQEVQHVSAAGGRGAGGARNTGIGAATTPVSGGVMALVSLTQYLSYLNDPLLRSARRRASGVRRFRVSWWRG